MTVYALVYPKGGVSKTTLAVHLAAHFARRGPTLLLDGDAKQEKAALWAYWRSGNGVEPAPVTKRLTGKALYHDGQKIIGLYENTVIDTGGHDGPGMRSALALADRVISPTHLSSFDAAEMGTLMDIVQEVRPANPTMAIRALICGVDAQDDTTDVRAFLADWGAPAFQTTMGHRKAYWRSTAKGMTVEEYKPKTAAATYEMGKFYEEAEAWQTTR